MTGVFAALTDVGKRRKMNQDVALAEALPGDWTLLVVADGVGGAFGGEVASREAVAAIRESLANGPGDQPTVAIIAALESANVRVRDMQVADPALNQMATTVVVALVQAGHAWVVSLGDSRGYALEAGDLRLLTDDDSLVAEQVREGILTEDEARSSPHQNVITRGIGVEDDISDVDVLALELAPGSMLLLCTDGLYRAVEEPEIAMLMRHGDVQEVAKQLVARANANGGPDNIGVVLYRRPLEVRTE